MLDQTKHYQYKTKIHKITNDKIKEVYPQLFSPIMINIDNSKGMVCIDYQKEMRTLFAYLNTNSRQMKDFFGNRRLTVSKYSLMMCLGYSQSKQNNCNTISEFDTLISWYKENIHNFTIENTGKGFILTSLSTKSCIENAFHDDFMNTNIKQERLVFETQEVLTVNLNKKINKEKKDRVKMEKSNKSYNLNENTKLVHDMMLDHLNRDLPYGDKFFSNLFWHATHAGLPTKIENYNYESDGSKKTQVRLFGDMKNGNHKPIYSFSNKSCRLNYSDSILSFKKEFREFIFKSCFHLDLKSSQFVLITNILDLQEGHKAIASNRSLWSILIEDSGYELTDASKSATKTAMYSVCYGSGKSSVQIILEDYPNIINHPIFKEIFQKRSMYMFDGKSIKKELRDVFGNTYKVLDVDANLTKSNFRSAFACIMQAMELKIISSVFRYAENTGNISIVGFLHDGAYLQIHTDWTAIMQDLNIILEKECISYGFKSHMKFDFREGNL